MKEVKLIPIVVCCFLQETGVKMKLLESKSVPGKTAKILTLSLPRSSIDDLVFSVFTSNFLKLSYKISLIKNRFVTLFFIRFS